MVSVIEVDQRTYDIITTCAKVMGVSPGEIVRRLIQPPGSDAGSTFPPVDQPPSSPTPQAIPARGVSTDAEGRIEIFRYYKGVEVLAQLDPRSHEVHIASGPLSGQIFGSPSAAAQAVVAALNPRRARVETNGWRFWVARTTGEAIDHLGPRRSPQAKTIDGFSRGPCYPESPSVGLDASPAGI